MKCEICGDKATIHLTRIDSGLDRQFQENHLCERCADVGYPFGTTLYFKMRDAYRRMEQDFGASHARQPDPQETSILLERAIAIVR